MLMQICKAGDRGITVTLADLREQGVPFLWPSVGQNNVRWRSSRKALRKQQKKPQGYIVILCRDRDVELVRLIARGQVVLYR
jgi:hypothetical protein